jgi:hypothetical protein
MDMRIQKLLVVLSVGAVVVGLGAGFAFAARKTDGDQTRMLEEAAKSSPSGRNMVVKPDVSEDRGGCHFFYALDPNVVDQFPSRFVVLPDRRIVGIDIDGEDGVEAILHQCGAGSSAQWWALRVSNTAERILNEPEPPKLTTTAVGTELNYFMAVRNVDLGWGRVESALPEGNYAVRAVLTIDGKLTVTRRLSDVQ